jgi:GxxExxY protein
METRFADYLHSKLTERIIGSALGVHRALGPGLLEGTYRACLAHKLRLDGLEVQQEVPIPLKFEGIELDISYRADLIVEGKVLLELKAVQQLGHLHESQLLTYLKLSGLRVGLLLNFNVTRLRSGMQRVVL